MKIPHKNYTIKKFSHPKVNSNNNIKKNEHCFFWEFRGRCESRKGAGTCINQYGDVTTEGCAEMKGGCCESERVGGEPMHTATHAPSVWCLEPSRPKILSSRRPPPNQLAYLNVPVLAPCRSQLVPPRCKRFEAASGGFSLARTSQLLGYAESHHVGL